MVNGPWCKKLKIEKVDVHRWILHAIENTGDLRICITPLPMVQLGAEAAPLSKPVNDGQKINIVSYVGIAADEPLRIKKHIDKKNMVLPLVQIGWDEALCGLEAAYMDMLSPTYTDGQMRDGCWFCHNQGVAQLRRLRKNYPELWAKLLQLDLDSPVTFKADGHTVHDYDQRFQLEDEMLISPDEHFTWASMKGDLQYRLF